jgi:hypothetical protein
MTRRRWPDRADEQRRAAITNIAAARDRLADVAKERTVSLEGRMAIAEAKEWLSDAERYLVLARLAEPDSR